MNLGGFLASIGLGNTGKKTEVLNMQLGTDMTLYADAKAANKQRLSVKNTYHCQYRTQGRDENGVACIHCLKTNSRANPKDCGEMVAGCEG